MTHAVRRLRRRLTVLLVLAPPTLLACDTGAEGTDGGRAGAAVGTADTPAVGPVGSEAGADDPAAGSGAQTTLPAPLVETNGLVIHDLLVAEPVTGERAALYLTVRSSRGDVLVGMEAVGADSASLHETSMDEGVMRMRPVAEVAVPAGGEAALRPGGLHGMLEGLSAPWVPGDTVRLRLHFRDAGVVEAPALVIPYIELDTRFRGAGGGRLPGGTPRGAA